MVKGKVVGNIQGSTSTASRNLGINTNPLKEKNKIPYEEKKKGKKPRRQKIEETGA